jgi:dihydroneopterin aldolase
MLNDRIILKALKFYAYHGANDDEKVRGQPFEVDVEVERELLRAGRSDKLEDTTSYSHIYRIVEDVMLGPSHNLLESLGNSMAKRLLALTDIDAVRIKVTKMAPPVQRAILSGAAIEIYRRSGD